MNFNENDKTVSYFNSNEAQSNGFRTITRKISATFVLNLCSFCSVKNATITKHEDKYTVVYRSSTMTYVKYDKKGEPQAEGLISKCPVCGKDLIDDKEKWAPVTDEMYYEVSNKGRIKSYAQDPSGKIGIGGNFANGYKYQNFNDGAGEYVHKLVANAFIPNDFSFRCVNHKDHNRHNNDVRNVEWCTYSYNNANVDRTRYAKTSDCVAQIKDGQFINFFHSYTEAAKAAGISVTMIVNATHGLMNTAGGYEWQLVKIASRKQKQHDFEEFTLLKRNAS